MITLKYKIDGEDFSRDLPPGNYIVGRSKSCDIVISEPSISGQHLRIDVKSDGQADFRDLLSRNGTKLGGKKVQQGHLVNGAKLKLGHVEVDVKSDVAAAEPLGAADELAAPPPINAASEDSGFDLAPAPEPVDADFAIAQVSDDSDGSVEVFRPADYASAPAAQQADASRKRMPILLAMLGVMIAFVAVAMYMSANKPKKVIDEKNPQEVYWAAIDNGAVSFRDGNYSKAVEIWSEADKKLEGSTGNQWRIGTTFAEVAEPFSQSREGKEIKDVDWTTMRNKILTMVTDGSLSGNMRTFAMELEARVRKEINSGKVFMEGKQARAAKEWDLAVSKLREVSAESLYYLAAMNMVGEVEKERLEELKANAKAAAKIKQYTEAIKSGEEFFNRGGEDNLLKQEIEEWKNRRTVQQDLTRLRRVSRDAKTAEEIDSALTTAKGLTDRFPKDPDVMVQVPGLVRDLNERLYVVQLQQMYRGAQDDLIKQHLEKAQAPRDNVTVQEIVRRWKIVSAEKEKAGKLEEEGNLVEATDSWNAIILSEKNERNQYHVYAKNKLAQYPPETIGKMMATSALKAMNSGRYSVARDYLQKAQGLGADIKNEQEALQKTGKQLFNKGIQYYFDERYSEAREYVNDARDCFLPDDPYYNKIETWMREHNISPRKSSERKAAAEKAAAEKAAAK